MLKWIPNSDNTDFHLEKGDANMHCILSGGVWRIEVWIKDHKKIDCWAGKAQDTPLEDVQALAEALHETYRGWKG